MKNVVVEKSIEVALLVIEFCENWKSIRNL